MNKRFLTAFCAALWLAGQAAGAAETRVRVTGQRVNLRARADLGAEVVGQVPNGEVLVARSFQDDWVEVVPPDSVDLWVHRDFVRDNIVTASKLYVRAGAGINYSVVGSLSRGQYIAPKGEFGEWIRIAPPTDASLWVSRGYVEVLQPEKPVPARVQRAAPAAVPAPTPAAAPAAATVVRPAPSRVTPVPPQAVAAPAEVAQPRMPTDLALIPLEGQGRSVQREGVLLVSAFVIKRPSRYRLVRQVGNRVETICYIRGDRGEIGSYVGERLLVRGREYWVKGVRYPVVVADQVIPRQSSPR